MKKKSLPIPTDDDDGIEPDAVPVKPEPPAALLRLLAEMRGKAAHSESNGNFDTVWHEQVRRLETILNGGSHGS